MKKRRFLALAAAFTMLTSVFTPVYANEVDLDITSIFDEYEEDTKDEDDTTDEEKITSSSDSIDDDEPVTLGYSVQLDEEEIEEDDIEKEADGDWYEWDKNTGTLTLKGQLPDTFLYEGTSHYDIATQAGIYDGYEVINRDIVKKIIIKPNTKAGKSAQFMFENLPDLTEISGLENLDTSSVVNMSCMFRGCSSLTSLNVSGWNTSSVTDMYDMFSGCSSLKTLDFSGWDTSSVKDMCTMFSGCSSLKTLDLSGWDTSSVTRMLYMFYGCSSLESIFVSVSGWDTSSVTSNYKYNMFGECTSIKGGCGTIYQGGSGDYARIDTISQPGYLTANWYKWDAENGVLTLSGQLPETKLSSYTIYTIADQAGIYDAENVKKIIIKPNTKAGTSAAFMFYGLNNLTEISGLENFDTSSVRNIDSMFCCCESLTSLDLSGWNTSNVKNMNSVFSECSCLTTLNLNGWNTSKVTDIAFMFNSCYSLTSLDLSGWDTSAVTGMGRMFSGCSSLTSLDISEWDTSSVTDMGYMFSGCSSLTSLDISGWDTSSVTDMGSMFNGCCSLTSLDISEWDTSNIKGSYYDDAYVLGSYGGLKRMFAECTSLRHLDLSKWNVSNVKTLEGMFSGCSSLETLNLSGWDTSSVADMDYMFYSCISLTSLDISGWDTSSVKGMSDMFYECSSLTLLKLPKDFSSYYAYLPNISDVYLGWAKENTTDIISGSGEYAEFTTDGTSAYYRVAKYNPEKLATCTEDGHIEYYVNTDGKIYTDRYVTLLTDLNHDGKVDFYDTIIKAAHTYIAPTWRWSDDNSVAQADFICTVCNDESTLDAEISEQIDPEATCSSEGTKTITASVKIGSAEYTDTKTVAVPKLPHTYGAPSWRWNDDNTAAQADFTCTECNTVSTLEAVLSENVTTKPTCTKTGKKIVTAAVAMGDDTYTDDEEVIIPANGHAYSEPVWAWAADNTSASAEFTCDICSDKRTLNAQMSETTVTAPTCTQSGKKTITAKVVIGDKEYTDSKEIILSETGHSYTAPVWRWSEDYTSAFAKFICTGCNDEQNIEATMSENIDAEATCEQDGKKIITATVVMGDNEYTSDKEIIIHKKDHTYGKPVWSWTNGNTAATAKFTCSGCSDQQIIQATITETIITPAEIGVAGKKTVTAAVTFGGKKYSSSKEVTIPALVQPSPTITKIEPGNGKMNVAWQAVQGATSYKVYYKTGSTTKSVSRTGTGALISGIANGTYDVWVTAVVNGKETTQKNVKKATVKGYYVTCTTTSGMIAGGIKIDWTKFDGATKYRVVCIDKGNKVVGTAETTALTYQWKGLKNNTEYGFYVQPFVNGVYPTFTRTDANDKKYIQWTIPVNAPMITKLSLGNQKVWLYYESVPRATKYYIYYKQKGDTKDTLAGTTTNTKFLVTGIKNNVSTEFYVKALVDGKLTPLKRPATRTTRAGMKPTVTATAGQAALKWTKYTDCKASATKYKVVFVDANYKQIDTRETSNLAFTWKDKRLVKGKKYGFYVVPYVNGEYIPFGLSHAEDKANVVMFTAK